MYDRLSSNLLLPKPNDQIHQKKKKPNDQQKARERESVCVCGCTWGVWVKARDFFFFCLKVKARDRCK